MDMHCLLALGSLLVLTLACSHNVAMSHSDYPGVIELVGYSNRRARTYYKPSQEQLPPASAKIQADIETVKQNIEKYNKLLTLDTKNLPESQKDMLERIVERVARLKESLDINEKLTQVLNKTQPMIATKTLEDNENSTANPADTSSALLDEDQDKTEPTLILDVTTLQQLQTSMDKLEAVQGAVSSYTSQQLREGPTTTELNYETESDQESTEAEQDDEYNVFDSTTLEPLTDTTANDEQFVAARANNNLAITAAADDTDTVPTFSTTSGSQRTLTTSSGTKMTKTRATKRPGHSSTKNSHTISSNKRKPVTSSSASLSSASAAYAKASNKHNNKLSSTTVTQPISSSMQQHQQQQQHYQHRITQKPLPPIYQSQPPKAISSSPLATDKYSTSSSSATSATNGLTVDNNAVIGSSSTSATAYPDTNLPATPVLGTGYSSANSQNFVYDNHVNTSAIIYSLNNAREEFYHQKQTNLANLGANNKDETRWCIRVNFAAKADGIVNMAIPNNWIVEQVLEDQDNRHKGQGKGRLIAYYLRPRRFYGEMPRSTISNNEEKDSIEDISKISLRVHQHAPIDLESNQGFPCLLQTLAPIDDRWVRLTTGSLSTIFIIVQRNAKYSKEIVA
uniref:SUN domain-containing protein n=1 Tax=Glossina austeni TaxID=7395 RepID=A0A1A9UIF4_GLOAU